MFTHTEIINEIIQFIEYQYSFCDIQSIHFFLHDEVIDNIDTNTLLVECQGYLMANYTACKLRHPHHAITCTALVEDSQMLIIKAIDAGDEYLYSELDEDKIFVIDRYSELAKYALMYDIDINQ